MNTRISIVLALLMSFIAVTAAAQGFDARGMAMGGVALSQKNGRLARINPAYTAVPQRVVGAPRSIPIPIGIIQAIKDFPELDPDDPDFDALEIINYAANIPWAWEFRRPETLDTDVEITLGRNQLILDLNDAQSIVPTEGFDIGGMIVPFDAAYRMDLGAQNGVFRFSFFRPFLYNQVDLEMDERLESVLADAVPVEPDTDYGMNIDALLQGGFTSGLTYAREIGSAYAGPPPSSSDEDWLEQYWAEAESKPRYWVGAAYRRYFGGGYSRLTGDATMRTQDPIFGDAASDSFDIDYSGRYRQAWVEDMSSFGQGNALDVGAVMRWRNFEFGAGISDILTELSWTNTREDEAFFDETTGSVDNQRVRDDFTSKTEIPKSWILNASYLGTRWMMAANYVEEPGGTSFHSGAEYWTSDWVALRGGLEVDQRQRLQGGWGVGFRVDSWGFDVGFRTHNRGLTDRRGISMGLALVLY